MRPIRSILEIRYENPAKQFNFLRGLIQAIGGTPKTGNELQIIQKVRIPINNRRISIHLEATRYAINIEEQLEEKELGKILLDLSEKINSQLQWGTALRIGLRMMWTKEVSDFEKLVNLSKQKLFSDNSLVNESIDVAVPLTLLDGENRINYNYGAMKREELSIQGFEFETTMKDVSDFFAFIDVDYFALPNRTFSASYLRGFIGKAIPVAQKKLLTTLSILGL
ncbi:MAG: hypothetical protein HY033_02000 [Ignavibacteriae bacterium]|nr:hypothetical protein [Ignavibacteria bacterium]MBI3363660.1 hypothetical protein [Ignavibacteriota bacterium]